MEEIILTIFSAFFAEAFNFLLFAPIGVAYLFLRYRDKLRVQKVLLSEYENQYANAGQAVVLNTIAALGALAMAAMVILALITPILNWIRR